MSDGPPVTPEPSPPPPAAPPLMLKPPTWWFWLPIPLVLVVDLLTKAWLVPDAAWPGVRFFAWLMVEPHHNKGVAWGMLSEHPEWVAIGTLILIPVIIAVYWTGYRGLTRLGDLAFGCIIGGAFGNAWDRVRTNLIGDLEGVRDFIRIDFHPIGIDYTFPIFNVADIGISVGFCALVLLAILDAIPRRRPAAATSATKTDSQPPPPTQP